MAIKKSIIESDSGDDDITRKSSYSRQNSQEFTQDQLNDLKKEARKEGKRDILMSQLVEQQAETAKTLETITVRLTEGGKDIDSLKENYSKLEDESEARLSAITKVGEQAAKATTLIETHINDCDKRKESEDARKDREDAREDARWDKLHGRIDDAIKPKTKETKALTKNPKEETILDKVTANVISALIIAAMLGGLGAYFIFMNWSTNAQNAGQNNQSQPTSR